jgi:hypothetical protein
VNTIVTFTGEVEFTDFFGTAPGTIHVTFLLFVLLVAIVWFNLLKGLAVGDTEDIRKNG